MNQPSLRRVSRRWLALSALLVAPLASSAPNVQEHERGDATQFGAGPSLRRLVIAAGGGGVIAGTIAIRGTMGQPFASARLGAALGLTSGYWAPRTAAPASCFGDANFDTVVNFTDITAVLSSFASTGPQPLQGDADASGVVNFGDITAVLSVFGTSCP